MNFDWLTIVAILVVIVGVGYFVMKRRSKG